MRCWLSVLLLVLLPLQFSWAAMASYCAHEVGSQPMHAAHHDHAHHADPHSTDAGAADNALDPDCGHCHGHCTGALFAVTAVAGGCNATCPQAQLGPAALTGLPAPPERPQWRPLA
jgi:hypothetical protein